jgi:hypothetical protein
MAEALIIRIDLARRRRARRYHQMHPCRDLSGLAVASALVATNLQFTTLAHGAIDGLLPDLWTVCLRSEPYAQSG